MKVGLSSITISELVPPAPVTSKQRSMMTVPSSKVKESPLVKSLKLKVSVPGSNKLIFEPSKHSGFDTPDAGGLFGSVQLLEFCKIPE